MHPTPDHEAGHARTQAMLQRLHKAMREIEAEIAAHQGVYPYNHGRVTQSELCRRADVKKATLQTPLHKDSTRVEVLRWLDTLAETLTHNRDATRERVTAQTERLALEVERLTQALAEAQARIDALSADNQRLQAASRPV